MLIVIDGPAGSGKSSVSKIIAKNLNINYLDTGCMYRLITYYFISNNIIINETNIKKYLPLINISFVNEALLLNNKDVNSEIRSDIVNQEVSKIANSALVREKLVNLQREIVKKGDFIADGRDLGSYVFPQADYKFYLTASVKTRAQRRYQQNQQLQIACDYQSIYENIQKRDYNDMHRIIGPLVQAKDAILIDSSNMSKQEVVNTIINYIKKG